LDGLNIKVFPFCALVARVGARRQTRTPPARRKTDGGTRIKRAAYSQRNRGGSTPNLRLNYDRNRSMLGRRPVVTGRHRKACTRTVLFCRNDKRLRDVPSPSGRRRKIVLLRVKKFLAHMPRNRLSATP
jgi:hypothetical protein